MRALRVPLVGTVIVALLGGLGGAVLAQEAEAPPLDEPHRVTGQLRYDPYGSYSYGQASWNEERRVEERRGAWFADDPIEMDDPRLGGLNSETWNWDTYGGTLKAGRGEVMASRVKVVNDDGYWIGTMRGYVAYEPGRHLYMHYELTGKGAYEGHSALLYATGPQGGPWDFEGFVFPGPVPEYPDAPVVE